MDGARPDAGARPARSLKARAIAWLAQRERSRVELRARLLAWLAEREDGAPADPEQEVDALLDWLAANQYLSESRFVESRVHARAARYGNLRIRHELARHDLRLSTEAEAALAASEYERALTVWQRRYGAAPADAAARARQSRFLAARGFSPDVIGRVLRAGSVER